MIREPLFIASAQASLAFETIFLKAENFLPPPMNAYRSKSLLIVTGLGVTALAVGLAIPLIGLRSNSPNTLPWSAENPSVQSDQLDDPDSRVLAIASKSDAEQRRTTLEAIATGQPLPDGTTSAQVSQIDRYRARYLLAHDLIAQNQGGSALPLLENLETEYPIMAAPILAKRAEAETASGDSEAAKQTWERLVAEYPDSPIAAEGLFALGQWDEAIAQFPGHPRTLDIAETRLQEDPNQPQLLLLIARHGIHRSDYIDVLDRLKTEFSDQLQPQDWEALGYGYWEKWYYGSAGSAYEKAPATPLNRYRAGRGAQLGQRNGDAIAAYKRLAQEFPEAEDTAQGLIRLSQLVQAEEAIPYLDQVIERFPDRAGDALLERAKRLDQLQSAESATQARESLRTQYSDSDAAAELRWQQAEAAQESGDLELAWKWASELVTQNPDSDWAPEAAFWVGKWASQLGQREDAKTAFEHVLKQYPQSYYAWRSAVYLGWDVGDFTSIRTKIPALTEPDLRATLPSGSETLNELYRLGQDEDAWGMWQVEFDSRMEPSVAEQFTDGVMLMGIGDNLEGIFMLDSLDWRPKIEANAEADSTLDFDTVKNTRVYWQALYPFPYQDTITAWAQERSLNPVLVTALIRQESRFEPRIKSVAGATGLMQVMPATADWIAQQTGSSDYTMSDPEDNVEFGTWYLDYTHREYDSNSLFAVASYNAGPGNVANWIQRFGFSDPDVFVEQIPFPETKGYVESVFENYWNYLRLYNPEVAKQLARYSPAQAELVVSTDQGSAPK
ncbi:MAG: transglycosylase SLT domain-containing protein [Elainellaceae cyanobacterium]